MEEFRNEIFLESVRNRQEEAITKLINAFHTPLIRASLAHKISNEQAEDVVAETWSTFFEKIDNFKGQSHIKTYLFGIMYNKVRELKKKLNKYVEIEDPLDFLGANFNDKGFWSYIPAEPDAFIQAVDLSNHLDDCLEVLNDNQKRAFYLKEIEGESADSICEIIKTTYANYKVLLHRARNQVRRCVEMKNG